eukprot:jgi/Botrbrau1/569/Bobra.0010s0035.1
MSVEEKRRTILFGITARGQDALREAGIALPDAGWLHGLAVGRTTFVHNYPKRKLKTNSKKHHVCGARALVDHLTSQARQLAPPGKLTFFYKHFLTDVKVKRKVCTFVGPEGMVDASFHLLIGADGVWSGGTRAAPAVRPRPGGRGCAVWPVLQSFFKASPPWVRSLLHFSLGSFRRF